MKENYMDHQTSGDTEDGSISNCPECGAPCIMTWSGLDLVSNTGDETLAQKHYKFSPPSTQEETNEEIEAKFAKASKKIIDNAPVVAAYKKVNQEEPTTQNLDAIALAYARDHSQAPDKETPDWIITDFKAGANWGLSQLRGDHVRLLNWLLDNDYIKTVLIQTGGTKKHFKNWKTSEDVLKEFHSEVISSEPTQEELWINVKDRLPEGNALLLTSSQMIVIGDLYQGKWRVNGKWHHNGNEWVSDFKYEDITHWQPLPPPPKNFEIKRKKS